MTTVSLDSPASDIQGSRPHAAPSATAAPRPVLPASPFPNTTTICPQVRAKGTRRVAHRSRPPYPCLAHGEPRLRSHTSIGSSATMRRTSNWRCGCSYPWPRWIGRSAPLDGPKGWTCWRAPDLGGNGERMSRAIGRSVRVHRFGAKSGRSQQPRAMPPPVPMALTGGATYGGQGNRQAG